MLSTYWQNSNNEKLIEATHKYWQGRTDLSSDEIDILACYLHQAIEKAPDYPHKNNHLNQVERIKNLEDIKILNRKIMDWGINPW